MDRSPRAALEQRYGLKPGELSEIVFNSQAASDATVGAVREPAVWDHVRAVLNLSPAQTAEMKQLFYSGDRLDQALLDYIRAARPALKTGLLSNALSNARDFFTLECNIAGLFDEIVISAEVGVRKPDPQIYHIALQKLAVHPEEAVFVDDFIENIRAAEALGLKAVWFRSTAQAVAEIDKLRGPGPAG
jgi:putative hydrolase of the HAD superfamily